MTEKNDRFGTLSRRPKCLECGAPADVLVTDNEPYCAKHGLPILKQRKSLQCIPTFDTRSSDYATRYNNRSA